MKIAVTYKDGDVFQHFGKTEEFIICRAENGKVSSHTIVNNPGKGTRRPCGLSEGYGSGCPHMRRNRRRRESRPCRSRYKACSRSIRQGSGGGGRVRGRNLEI